MSRHLMLTVGRIIRTVIMIMITASFMSDNIPHTIGMGQLQHTRQNELISIDKGIFTGTVSVYKLFTALTVYMLQHLSLYQLPWAGLIPPLLHVQEGLTGRTLYIPR